MAKFCDQCGAELNKQTGFCPVCGGAPVNGEKPLEDVPLEPPVTAAGQRRASFCGKCGKPADPQTGYCAACGVMTRYAPVPAAKAAPQPPTRKIPKQKKKKRGRAVLWLVAIAAVLLAAAAVVGVLVHFGVADIPAVWLLEERMGISLYKKAIYDENSVLQGYEAHGYTDTSAPVIWQYNTEGQKVKTLYYENGTLRYYETYGYDSAGQMIRRSHYNSNGTQTGFETYEYDYGRQLIGICEYNKNGTLQATYWNRIG